MKTHLLSIILVSLFFGSLVSAYPDGWSDDIRITYTPEEESSYIQDMTIDSNNNIHIVWNRWNKQYDGGNRNYNYYKKLDNDGNIIIDDLKLSENQISLFASYPSIGIDSNDNVHIVWNDERDGNREIYYKKLDNDGNVLIDDLKLTNALLPSYKPKIAIDFQDNLNIVWEDWRDRNWEIYYKKLDNNGNTIIDDLRITNDPANSFDPNLAIDSENNIQLVWRDGREDISEVYYKKLDNFGNTLIFDTRISSDPTESFDPKIGVDSNDNLHIVWIDTRNRIWQDYYTKLSNNGNTIIDDMQLRSHDLSESDENSILVDSNGNVHIASRLEIEDGNKRVYYTKLSNNGDILIDNLRLSQNLTLGFHLPLIKSDSYNNLHLIWYGWDESHSELYYKKGINFAPEITSAPNTRATQGELYTYDVEATDFNVDPLFYSLIESPNGMNIDPITGLIQWVPPITQPSTPVLPRTPSSISLRNKDPLRVTLKVSDGVYFDTQSYVITLVSR